MPRRLILAVCALAIAPVLLACGDDDDDSGTALPGTSPTAAGSRTTIVSAGSPTIEGPASKYSVSIEDIGLQWRTSIDDTLIIDSASYARTRGLFESEEAGKRLLKDWGYKGGYQTAYVPEGVIRDAVLNGSYYITIETQMFETAAGAQAGYEYLLSRLGAGLPVQIQPIGDASVGVYTVTGTIAGSAVKAAYHQVVSRRGNVISIVLTKGAEGFMKVDPAWKLAKIADDKLTGERSAIEPTPTSNYQKPNATPAP